MMEAPRWWLSVNWNFTTGFCLGFRIFKTILHGLVKKGK
jgi:hypothetical protein